MVVVDVEVTAAVQDAAISDRAMKTEQSPAIHLILPGKRFFIHSPFVYWSLIQIKKGTPRGAPIAIKQIKLHEYSLLSKHGRHYNFL